jgi:hypothetical protein
MPAHPFLLRRGRITAHVEIWPEALGATAELE